MNKRTILAVVGIIVAVVGFLVFTQPSEQAAGEVSEHKIGAGTTGVTLLEYGDFQCPGCAQYYSVLREVKDYYGDKITFQFRNFPLESIHKNARAAARAAEAANMQGKFWEMHNILFETQTQWQDTSDPINTFMGYAEKIGIENLDKFKEDYKSSAVSSIITADLQAGREVGVESTPTFFIDGKKLDPSPSATPEAFIEIIDAQIAEKTGQKPEGQEQPAAPNSAEQP